MEFEFIYSDEEDKAYGLAGMAISLASLDALDRVAEVSLDAGGPMISFAHVYFHSFSPVVSPKAVWGHLLSNFQVTASAVMANIMARTIVRRGTAAGSEVFDAVRALAREEGGEVCGLDPDESDAVFDKVMHHNLRIFTNQRVHPAVRSLAALFMERRRLSVGDLAEALDMLSI